MLHHMPSALTRLRYSDITACLGPSLLVRDGANDAVSMAPTASFSLQNGQRVSLTRRELRALRNEARQHSRYCEGRGPACDFLRLTAVADHALDLATRQKPDDGSDLFSVVMTCWQTALTHHQASASNGYQATP